MPWAYTFTRVRLNLSVDVGQETVLREWLIGNRHALYEKPMCNANSAPNLIAPTPPSSTKIRSAAKLSALGIFHASRTFRRPSSCQVRSAALSTSMRNDEHSKTSTGTCAGFSADCCSKRIAEFGTRRMEEFPKRESVLPRPLCLSTRIVTRCNPSLCRRSLRPAYTAKAPRNAAECQSLGSCNVIATIKQEMNSWVHLCLLVHSQSSTKVLSCARVV